MYLIVIVLIDCFDFITVGCVIVVLFHNSMKSNDFVVRRVRKATFAFRARRFSTHLRNHFTIQ